MDSRSGQFLATLDGNLSLKAQNGRPALDKNGKVVADYGNDQFGSWSRRGSDHGTGYGAVFSLGGVFVIRPENMRWIAGDASENGWPITNLLAVCPVSQTEDRTFPDAYYCIVSDRGASHLPVPTNAKELVFLATDVDAMAAGNIQPVPQQKDDGTLASRERTTLLKIIRALDVMAKLPVRGAAASVERQLQELGFDGPKDATIRSVLKDARDLDTDARQ